MSENPTNVADAVDKAGQEIAGDRHSDVVPQINPQTGELELLKAVPVEKKPVQESKEFTNNEQGGETNKEQEPTGWEKRYRDLQSHTDKKLQDERDARIRLEERLKNIEKQSDGGEQNKAPESPADPLADIDFDELVHQPDKLKQVLGDAIRKSTESQVKKALSEAKVEVPADDMQKAIEDYKIRTELTEVMTKYKDFGDYTESMQFILEQQPEATYEQAYLIAKKIGAPSDKDSKSLREGGNAADSAQEAAAQGNDQTGGLSAKELQERAAKLRTEQSVPGSHSKKRGAPSSPADAVNQAFDELGF